MTDEEFDKFLDNKTDEWHNSATPLEIHQHLRMSGEEWLMWMLTGKLPRGMKERWGFK